jgi:hypothetical protein
LESRRRHWQELEQLCKALEGWWRKAPPAAEVSRFADLYRSACANLALADAYQLPPATIRYLHQLVGRRDVGQSQLLLVSNGSFLLNATLVNHEHRKLAGKLIDAIGPGGRDVVFLESGQLKLDQPTSPNPAVNPSPVPFIPPSDENSVQRPREEDADRGPPIRRAEPAPDAPNGLDFLLVWPTNWILLHFAMIGILYCFWKLPIFGLPRAEDAAGLSDFGRHVDAVAALLRRTADRRYALSRVQHYQQIVKKVE